MINTVSNNKQLFVVDAIADAGLTPDQIPENTLGIIDNKTNLTVSPATYKSLPDKYRLLGRKNGEFYDSFATIQKDRMRDTVAQEYEAPQPQKWKGIIENCDCIKSVRLEVHLLEASILAEVGQSWTSRDSFVEVSPAEFACFCSCEGNSVYENNVMTMLLYKKILDADSPFYTAEVHEEGGSKLDDLQAIESFIENNKDNNTDDDKDNNGKKLELHIITKTIMPTKHRDIEPYYLSARGAIIEPVIHVNDESKAVMFEKYQDANLEIGSGYDLKQLEYNIMQYYTELLNPRDFDGFDSELLVYQTNPTKKYDSVSFAFGTDKVERSGQGDFRDFVVILATEHDSGVFAKLKKIFVK